MSECTKSPFYINNFSYVCTIFRLEITDFVCYYIDTRRNDSDVLNNKAQLITEPEGYFSERASKEPKKCFSLYGNNI